MSERSWKVRLAAAAATVVCAWGVGSPARAGESGAFDLSLQTPPRYLDENTPSTAPGAPSINASRAPLMAAFEAIGVAQPLDDARINIYGHIEGSYTYNTGNPAGQLNLGRVFDINNNRGQINQIDLNIERKADLSQFDLGGRIEMLYGTDARFIHSSDFIDYGNKNVTAPGTTSLYNGPEYQFDIPQLYLDLTAPLGNGLRLRFGKFLFFKQIDPNASVFYSHSFTFGAALPFTLTGVTAYYPICDAVSIEGGFSRGWGQTLTDNNGAIDGLGRVAWKIDKSCKFTLAMITGPELNGDNSHYRTTFDATLSCNLDPRTTLLFDGVYGYQAQPSGTGADQWYGISGYVVYKLSNYTNLNGRAEFYRDEEGFTTAIRQTLYEVTLGVTVTPFPDSALGQGLKIRPEARYDYSSADFFNGLRDHNQFTLAVDAYWDF